jgi:hypothetical protein
MACPVLLPQLRGGRGGKGLVVVFCMCRSEMECRQQATALPVAAAKATDRVLQ